MVPRLFVALNVNDRDLLDPTNYAEFIKVRNADSAVAVQGMLRSGERSADIFLVDVDMRHYRAPRGLEWGHPTLRLYGPLLALPFLDGNVLSAFVPYSNYWGYPAVTNNGFVLVAVSLLLSQVHQQPFSLSDVTNFISSSIESGRGLVNEAEGALVAGLEQLRKRIENDSDIQLVDVADTIDRLENLEQDAQISGRSLSVPFEDAEGLLSVTFCKPPHFTESIQLASMFADELGFRPRNNPETFSQIYRTLERWKAKSVVCWGDTLYDSVIDALSACARGIRVNQAAEGTAFVRRKGSVYQVIRLAMEFAWVNAWFGEPISRKRAEMVHRFLGMEDLTTSKVIPSAGNFYKRLLGVSSQKRVDVSKDSWRAPFKQSYSGVMDAYKLDQDAEGTLTPFERSLCIRYAVEELQWDALGDPSKARYPVWMT